MNLYPDTSFLCSLYREQENSLRADAFREKMTVPLPFTRLLEFEFLQSIELQVWLHTHDRKKGYSRSVADSMITDWQSDVAAGLNVLVPADTDLVISLAADLSRRHTAKLGNRTLDILHLATAIHLGAKTFLTFDERQKELAKGIGLKVPL